MLEFQNDLNFAKEQDQQDELRRFRDDFHFPSFTEKPVIYFTGNSLGLQPKKVESYLQRELETWKRYGVEGHFMSDRPWFSYHENLTEIAAKIVGAKPSEVVVTHSLTTNLHLLMTSFYRPQGKRVKILCEGKAFPSDQYALESQLKLHGLNTSDHLIELFPREGEHTVRHEDVLEAIDRNHEELALIMMGGVHYYSGQKFNMKEITAHAKKYDLTVGFDLAHAAGNVELNLHDWGVDFAAWCSYKYLNSSPGGVSGLYVHEAHHNNKELHRLAGWWGHNKETRFLMEPGFDPIPSAEAWQLSNAPVLTMAAHLASLEIFDEAGMEKIGKKRDRLTAYLAYVIQDISKKHAEKCRFEIITPLEPSERGAQLSILAHGKGKAMFDLLSKEGVIADWREPNVIRIAPAPLYNSYEDVYRFGQALEKSILS